MSYKLNTLDWRDIHSSSSIKLRAMSKDIKYFDYEKKCVFIINLAQHMYAECWEHDPILVADIKIEDKQVIEKYADSDDMRDFIKLVLKTYEHVCYAYGLPSTIHLVEEMWTRPEINRICKVLGVQAEGVDTPKYDSTGNPLRTAIDRMGGHY